MLKNHHDPPWPPHFHDFHILTDWLEQAKLDIIHCCQLNWWTSCVTGLNNIGLLSLVIKSLEQLALLAGLEPFFCPFLSYHQKYCIVWCCILKYWLFIFQFKNVFTLFFIKNFKKNIANNLFKEIAPVKSTDLWPDPSFTVN